MFTTSCWIFTCTCVCPSQTHTVCSPSSSSHLDLTFEQRCFSGSDARSKTLADVGFFVARSVSCYCLLPLRYRCIFFSLLGNTFTFCSTLVFVGFFNYLGPHSRPLSPLVAAVAYGPLVVFASKEAMQGLNSHLHGIHL